MLGHQYRYVAFNNTGVSVNVTIKERPWKFASDGTRDDAAEVVHLSASSLGAAAYGPASAVNNSTTKYLGAHLLFTVAPSASATGTVALYVQHSTDGGTTWPSNGQGRLISVNTFAASATAVTSDALVR